MTAGAPCRKLALLVGLVIGFLQSYSHGQTLTDSQTSPSSNAGGYNLKVAGFDVVPYADIVNNRSVSGIALMKTF